MYSQAVPGLLNACSLGQCVMVSKQKFDHTFFYLVGLEDQFSTMEDAVVHLY